MSNVTRPRGPLPPRVYWVRRLLVLGVALLLVLGIGRVLGGGSDGTTTGGRAETVAGESSGTATSPSYGPTAPVPPTTAGRGGRKRGQSATPQATPSSALPEPTGVCADDDVHVTPVLGAPAGGADVVVRLDFTTTLSLACTVAVSPETIALRLSTEKGRFVWSTQSCPAAMPVATVVARRAAPGSVPGSVAVVWSAHYADSTCSAAGAWAVPGWYHAVASVLGGTETDVSFQLGPAVAATVTRTASPTGTPAASGTASAAATRRPVASAGSTPTGRPAGSPSGAVEPTG